jgi:hypothetical protein
MHVLLGPSFFLSFLYSFPNTKQQLEHLHKGSSKRCLGAPETKIDTSGAPQICFPSGGSNIFERIPYLTLS